MEKYNVIYSGKVLPDFDEEKVVYDFVKITNLPKTKATQFIKRNGSTYIKKGVSESVALKFKKKLTSIGMDVKIIGCKDKSCLSQSKETSNMLNKAETLQRNDTTPQKVGNKITKSSYGFLDRINDIFYQIELTRRNRLGFAIAITSVLIALGIFKGAFPVKLGAIAFLSIPTIFSLYILSSVFNIESARHKAIIITAVLAYFSFKLYQNIHLNHSGLDKSLFISMIVSSLMVLGGRFVFYLFR